MRAPPYFVILGRSWPHWYPCLELTRDGNRGEFLRIADRLVREFGGTVVEQYGRHGDSDKEYWWIDFGPTRLLLMRKPDPIGTGLSGAGPDDIDLLSRIGQSFGAQFIGWRWNLWRLQSRFGNSRVSTSGDASHGPD